MKSLIEKEYFTLEEVMEELHIPRRDVVYLAENSRLRLSTFVCDLFISCAATGDREDGEWDAVPEITRWTGVLDLWDRDALRILKTGTAEVSSFHPMRDSKLYCSEPTRPVVVSTHDLVIRVEERRRLEALIRKKPEGSNFSDVQSVVSFVHAPDYRMVQIAGETFSLGIYQAAIVRLLHKAALTGRPWCNGAELLAEVECSTLRMSDLFKSKRGWRKLIESNSRGMYRLAGIARS